MTYRKLQPPKTLKLFFFWKTFFNFLQSICCNLETTSSPSEYALFKYNFFHSVSFGHGEFMVPKLVWLVYYIILITNPFTISHLTPVLWCVCNHQQQNSLAPNPIARERELTRRVPPRWGSRCPWRGCVLGCPPPLRGPGSCPCGSCSGSTACRRGVGESTRTGSASTPAHNTSQHGHRCVGSKL